MVWKSLKVAITSSYVYSGSMGGRPWRPFLAHVANIFLLNVAESGSMMAAKSRVAGVQ
jgi:hypothetical protein